MLRGCFWNAHKQMWLPCCCQMSPLSHKWAESEELAFSRLPSQSEVTAVRHYRNDLLEIAYTYMHQDTVFKPHLTLMKKRAYHSWEYVSHQRLNTAGLGENKNASLQVAPEADSDNTNFIYFKVTIMKKAKKKKKSGDSISFSSHFQMAILPWAIFSAWMFSGELFFLF